MAMKSLKAARKQKSSERMNDLAPRKNPKGGSQKKENPMQGSSRGGRPNASKRNLA
jgi:hypothetical protein